MPADYLGIDPGLNGAFAVISGDRIRYKMVMPTISIKTKGGKTRREIVREGVLSFLATLPLHTHVAIEKQEAYRSQNVTSSCTICKNYGILLMALSATHMNITEVPSEEWQKHFGIVSKKKAGGQSTKEQAFPIAQALYPEADFLKSERSRRPHDGIVDACLIAHYCQSLFQSSSKIFTPLVIKLPNLLKLEWMA